MSYSPADTLWSPKTVGRVLGYTTVLLQPTQTKFKQQQPQQRQKTTQFKYENSTKTSKLHFSDLQNIYIWTYASYISCS